MNLADLLDELQEHVESIDMANGKCLTFFVLFFIAFFDIWVLYMKLMIIVMYWHVD